jgi:hypothetical protein
MSGWKEKNLMRHWRKLRLKNWQLVLVLLVFATSSVFFLRQNNLKMVELRNRVVAADEQAGNVTGALEALNHHVFHHMNTEIVRPVELVNTYNNQAKVVIEAANKTSGRDIYAEATAACERRGIPLSSIAQCTANYAINNNPGVGPSTINLPDKNRFIYTFATPVWTPDAAGFSLLITGVVMLWLSARLLEYILVRIVVRRRLRNSF